MSSKPMAPTTYSLPETLLEAIGFEVASISTTRVATVCQAVDAKQSALVIHDHLLPDDALRKAFCRDFSAYSQSLCTDGLLPVTSIKPLADRLVIFAGAGAETTLGSLLQQNLPEDFAQLLTLLSPCLKALDAVHAQGKAHGGLSPHNIWIAEGGNALIAELGILSCLPALPKEQRDTVSSPATSEPAYMSPDSCRGQNAGMQGDIYSLGCIFYQALAGQPPFSGDCDLDIMYKQINSMPEPFGRDELKPLQRVVFKALEKNPRMRQQAVQQLNDDLVRALTEPQPKHNPIQIAPPTGSKLAGYLFVIIGIVVIASLLSFWFAVIQR